MKKNLTAALLVFFMLLTFAPVHTFAQECVHTWGEWYEVFEPTCTEEGTQRRRCEKCYIVETEPIPATKLHTWGKWKTIHKPTCIRTGTATRTCIICYGKDKKTLPKSKNHSWKKWVTTKRATALSNGIKKQTCSGCGKTQKKSIPKLKAKVSLKMKSVTIKSGKQYTLKIKSKTYGDKVKNGHPATKKLQP